MEALEQEAGADSARVFDQSYLLEGEVGRGKHGVVYRAKHQKLDQTVAIKVLSARLEDGSAEREAFSERVQALSSLEHSNLVRINDFGLVSDAPYVVMEFVEGETLEARLSRGALDPETFEALAPLVVRGLGYMHTRGSVHGELSPRHVIASPEGEEDVHLKLLGFAMSGMSGSASEQDSRTAYTAPELAEGSEPTPRSDVYAAGALLLQMLTGSEHAAGGAMGGASTLLPGQVEASELDAIIARALAEDPQERFGNADQMLKALLALPSPWIERTDAAPVGTRAAEPMETPRAEPIAIESIAPEEIEELVDADLEPQELSLDEPPVEKPPKKRGLALKLTAAGIALSAMLGAAAWYLLRPTPHAATGIAKPSPGGTVHVVSPQGEQPPSAAPAHAAEAKQARPGDAPHAAGPDNPYRPPIVVAAEEEKTDEPDPQPTAADSTKHGAAQPHEAQPSEHPPGPAAAPVGEHGPQPSAAEQGRPQQASQAAAHAAAVAPGDQPAHPPQAAEAPAHHAAEPAGQARVQQAEHAPDQPAAKAHLQPADHAPDHHAAEPAPQAHAQPVEHATAHATGPAVLASAQKAGQTEAAAPAPKPGAESEHAAHGSEPVPQPSAAAPPKPVAPYRHVRPSKAEIRQMFHLAATPTKPRGQPSDPWDGEMSKPLETLRASIAHGSTGNPQIVAALRRFNRTYPDEPHGHLLLGALYANRGWPLDALDEYAVAFQVDPSSRGAPEVLSNALSMVIHDQAGADAARFIQRTYQREALPAVDAALREHKADAAVLARLRSLRASIPGAPVTKTPASAAKAH